MWVKKKWPLVLLVLLFAVSVGLRWPAFSMAPESRFDSTWDRFNNYEIYKHTGYVFSVYETHTVDEHRFAGYVGKSASFLKRENFEDLYVYSSFPPTLFVVPYLVFTAFSIPVNLVSLDVFNLVLQLITTILIYYLLLEILPKRDRKRRELVAFLAAGAYIFSTGTLQGHMNVYWAHELLQPVFVGVMLLFAKRKGLFKWWESALVGFGLSIITWTGVLGAVGIALFGLYRLWKTKNRAYLAMIAGLAGGAVLALVLVAIQVMLITGADLTSYTSTIFKRVEARTANGSIYQPMLVVRQFITRLFQDYGFYLIAAYSMFLVYVRKIKPNFAWAIVAISAFPLLESIPLVEHDSVYAFGRLKWLLPIILILGLLSYEFLGSKQQIRRRILIGLFALAAIVHTWIYLDIFIWFD
jgi:hypothetical protein